MRSLKSCRRMDEGMPETHYKPFPVSPSLSVAGICPIMAFRAALRVVDRLGVQHLPLTL